MKVILNKKIEKSLLGIRLRFNQPILFDDEKIDLLRKNSKSFKYMVDTRQIILEAEEKPKKEAIEKETVEKEEESVDALAEKKKAVKGGK